MNESDENMRTHGCPAFMKTIINIVLCYVAMLIVFLVSIICVNLIPREKIRVKSKESSDIIATEGAYYNFSPGHDKLMLDNFTDALMINIAMTADNQHPVSSAMKMDYTWSGETDMLGNLAKVSAGEPESFPTVTYSRYWHGNQVFLRPLLTRYNLNGIRVINCSCFVVLLALLLYFLNKKTDIWTCGIFMLTLLAYILPTVPLSMQYSTCFYIGLISSLSILLCPKLADNCTGFATTLFVVGGVTAFFDLLTTPLVTLGLPLIVANLSYKRDATKKTFVGISSWGTGYGLLWASKWIFGSLLLGKNIITDAIESVLHRTSTVVEINYNYSIPSEEFRIILLCVVVVLWICLFASYKIKRFDFEYNWLLIIVLLAPTWYVVLFNHSLLHYWFTWRLKAPSAIALLLYLSYLIRKFRNGNSSSDSLLQREKDNSQGCH